MSRPGRRNPAVSRDAVAGAASLDIWPVVYRGRDFIGVVTIAGPGASADAVTSLAAQAYGHAAGTLH